MIEFRKAGVKENIEHGIEQVSRSLAHVEPAATLILREFGKEFRERIDVGLMAGDEVSVGEDDIEFTGESGAMVGIEEWYMHREKKASVILDYFRLIGRRDQLFDGEGVDGEAFLEIGNILVVGILEVNPGDLMEFHLMHGVFLCFRFGMGDGPLHSAVYQNRFDGGREMSYSVSVC